MKQVLCPDWRESKAPLGSYRVISWEMDGHKVVECYRDEVDYPKRAAAVARTAELAAEGFRASVYNDKGNSIHTAYEPGAKINYSIATPRAVTSLAGLSKEGKSTAGTYGRK